MSEINGHSCGQSQTVFWLTMITLCLGFVEEYIVILCLSKKESFKVHNIKVLSIIKSFRSPEQVHCPRPIIIAEYVTEPVIRFIWPSVLPTLKWTPKIGVKLLNAWEQEM